MSTLRTIAAGWLRGYRVQVRDEAPPARALRVGDRVLPDEAGTVTEVRGKRYVVVAFTWGETVCKGEDLRRADES